MTQVITPAMTSTKITAMDMPNAVSIFLDVPRKGQFPRNCASRMLLTKMVATMISIYSMVA